MDSRKNLQPTPKKSQNKILACLNVLNKHYTYVQQLLLTEGTCIKASRSMHVKLTLFTIIQLQISKVKRG